MINQLLKMVQDNTIESVINNKAIPNNLNSGVQKEFMSSIQNGITSAISSGDIGSLMNLFGKGANNQSLSRNPIYKSIAHNLLTNLVGKFGMSNNMANNLIKGTLPLIFNQFSQKLADPKDKSLDLNNIVQSVAGNQFTGKNLNDMLGQFISKSGKSKSTPKGSSKSNSAENKNSSPLLNVLSGFLKK
jgi:uncharacterized protein YidB (DUF937 family)